MKIRKIYDKKTGKLLSLATNAHFGRDDNGKIGWHGVHCSVYNSLPVMIGDKWTEKSEEILEYLDKQHKNCLKFPFKPKVRNDSYTII